MIAYKEFDTENMAIVAISDLESRGFRCIGGHKNANGKWAFYHEAHGHSKILKVMNRRQDDRKITFDEFTKYCDKMEA